MNKITQSPLHHNNLKVPPTSNHPNHRKTVCILNVLDDDVSIQLLYRNALDIHCKHTASQLHVAERVLSGVVV